MNPVEIVENLHRGVCKVVFEKANGEIREMRCTLDPNRLPEQQTLTEDGGDIRDHTRVWDVEANGWRSFRFESVRSFTPAQLLTENL
tara:strand:+ start:321 stop:581 length:261 start_codon:yes stop_codon:yes gene_type:complete